MTEARRSGMRVWTRAPWALLVVALWCGLSALASASTVKSLSLEQLAQKSVLIVVGVAEEAQARRHVDGKLIVTDVGVRVERVLKGDAKPGSVIVTTLLGGELDGIGLSVPGEASLPKGGRSLLFLYRAGRSKDLRVVGMAQGALPIEARPDGVQMVIPSSGDSALVDRGSDGALRPAPAALLQPEPMDSVVARVQQIVAAQKR
jgi:hypothetical protein